MPSTLFALSLLPLSAAFHVPLAAGLVRSAPARHAPPAAFFDFKKMVDPENAMERNVFKNELSGGEGEGAKEAMNKRKKEERDAKMRAQRAAKDGGSNPFAGFSLPNPFAKD